MNFQERINELDNCLKRIDAKGYIEIYYNDSWQKEHRVVVQLFINRELTSEECIHHINQNKSDNRIQNLFLFHNQKEHAKFHIKIKQYGYHTNPMKRLIENRWKEYEKELIINNEKGGLKNEEINFN